MTVTARGARRFAPLLVAVAALSASPAGASEPILGEASSAVPQRDWDEAEAAWIMLEAPRKSCGYSGDDWLEIDRKRVRRAVKKTENRVEKRVEKKVEK